MRRLPIMVCFFLSGAAGLVYEVLWMRSLALSFGHTVWAVTTVLVVFMGGLALGSFFVGRFVDRFKDPVRLYALLELGIGVYCLAAPRLLELSRQAHAALVPALGEGLLSRTTTQFFLGALVLLLPTTLMGGTVPAMAKTFITDPGAAGEKFGDLYGANTLGAAIGAFAAGYWLLPVLGIRGTNLLAAAVNISIAGFLLTAGRFLGDAPETGHAGAAPRTDAGPSSPAVPDRLLLWTFLLTGGASMIFQIAWVRSLILVIGSSTYAYSAVLVSVLLGIALGSCLFARIRLASRVGAHLLLAGIAASGFLLIPCFDLLPALFLLLFRGFLKNYAYIQFMQLLIVLLVVLLPATLMGMTLPCLVGMVVRDGASVGSDVGRYYAFNTAGAIIASVLAGFLLIPGIGTQKTLAAGIAIELFLAAAFLAVARPSLRGLAFPIAASLALGTFLYPGWNKAVMNLGVSIVPTSFKDMGHYSYITGEQSKGLLYAREGISSTVAVFDSPDGKRWFTVNGKPDGGRGDMTTQVRLGMIPLLLRTGARRVGVLGLGTGVTAGFAGHFEGVESIDVVELEPAVVEAAGYFERENGGVLKDRRTRIAINDGRSFFESRKGLYDVIVSEPSNPWISGVSNLYTVEFFGKIRESLSRGGIFGLWVQCYAISRESYGLILRTFLDVFPDATLWQVGTGDTLIVGATDRTGVSDLASIKARLAGTPKLSAALAAEGPLTLEPLLTGFLLGADDMRRCAGPGPLNTDDLNRLEFDAPKALYGSEMARIFWDIASCKGDSLPPFMKAAGADNDEFHRKAGEKHYLDGDYAMAWWEFGRLPSLAPRRAGKAGAAKVLEGGIIETFDGQRSLTLIPATTADRPETWNYDAWVPYQAEIARITRTSGVVRGAGRDGGAGLLLRGGKDAPVGYLAPIEVEPQTTYEVRCWIRGVAGDNTTAGIDVMEYDRREDDGAQPSIEFNREHLVTGSTPVYVTGVRGRSQYSFRFTTTGRSALIRLHFYVEGGIDGSVAFDDISIKRISTNSGREGTVGG